MKKHAAGIILMMMVSITACKKKQGDAAYTTHIAISDFLLNADSINVLYDENKITGNPALSYGVTTIRNNKPYLGVGAGTHTLRIVSGTSTVKENIISSVAGKYYTLLLYDSIKNSTVKTLLMNDNLLPVDTMAQVRFVNMIPGADTLTVIFSKDTTIYRADNYIGSKSLPTYAFSTFRPAATWQVSVARNSQVIVPPATFPLVAGKLYSFIAKGLKGGTGLYKESLVVVQHN